MIYSPNYLFNSIILFLGLVLKYIFLNIKIGYYQYISASMKNKVSLYWNIGSQPSRAVKALLDLSKILYNDNFVDLGKNQSRSPEYLKKNPLGQVPFITDEQNNLGLGESNAIMVYLAQRFPDQLGSYYGQSLIQCAKINEYLSWYQGFFRPALMGVINLKKYRYMMAKQSFSQQQYKIALQKQRNALKALNQRLQGNQYIVLNKLTVVDILFYFETSNLYYYGEQQLFDLFTNVKNWYKRVEEVQEIKNIQKQWHDTTLEKFKKVLQSIQPGKQPI